MLKNRGMQVLIAGVLIILVMSIGLFAWGYPTAASAISGLGTAVWMLLVLTWVFLIDSKRRWPHASLSQRVTAVMTFQRRP